MSTLKELFPPARPFSRDHPLLRAAERSHRLVFEAFDRTARLQLGFAADLVDMNRERFESLYAHRPAHEFFGRQIDLAVQLGERTARHLAELQGVFLAMQLDALWPASAGDDD